MTPTLTVRWEVPASLRLHLSRELEGGRTLASVLAAGRLSTHCDDYWLIGDVLCDQPAGDALRTHLLGVEHAGHTTVLDSEEMTCTLP